MSFIDVGGKRYETDLVIFDKDGTLLDFELTWVGIIAELIKELMAMSGAGPELSKRIQTTLGVFTDKRSIDGNGPFAMGTSFEVDILLTSCLYLEGIHWDIAQGIVREASEKIFFGPVRAQHLHASRGAVSLLKTLKERGILVAVATNDNQDGARMDMLAIGALPYLDLIVGADMVENTKPAPDMIHLVCSSLRRSPRNAVMIGDTMMDVRMGRNAGVMLNIGIHGIVPAETLRPLSDVLITSLEEIG